MTELAVVLLCCLLFSLCQGLDNGLALTPPMGFCSWERFGCNTNCEDDPDNCISENLYMQMADHLVSDGFKELGYQYVNIDDCWMSKERDSEGRLQPDPQRFPHGIKALADYVHSKGLKLGIYNDFGTKTCGGYPGSSSSLQLDMETFAEWGIDMLKMDGCSANLTDMPLGYARVSQYLNATGRPILFSCSWPTYYTVSSKTVDYSLAAKSCNMWRNYNDVSDSWASISNVVQFYTAHQDEFQPVAGPGHWNDPDMLVIGNFGLSYEEQKAQMAIWSVFAAPLLMSTDLRNLAEESKSILQNAEIIAVNQDKLGRQARQVYQSGNDRVLSKPLSDGSFAVVFINMNVYYGPHNITVDFKTVGLTATNVNVRDLFQQKTIGLFYNEYTAYVPPSGVVMVTMTPID